MLHTLNSWQSKGKDSQNIVVDYRFTNKNFVFPVLFCFKYCENSYFLTLEAFFKALRYWFLIALSSSLLLMSVNLSYSSLCAYRSVVMMRDSAYAAARRITVPSLELLSNSGLIASSIMSGYCAAMLPTMREASRRQLLFSDLIYGIAKSR